MFAPYATASLGSIGPSVERRLAQLDRDRIVERMWARDHTVWKPEPTEITNRLGWLSAGADLRNEIVTLGDRFRAELEAEEDGLRFDWIVLLGMGGSSLAPEVLFATFGQAPGHPDLVVLDTTDPAQIRAVEARVDLSHTLFIVSSKSGETIETRSQLAYFWSRIPDGRHFVVITDPGSSLDTVGRELGVRRTYRNPAEIGGRYSALSYFGMVPAALVGVDVESLLDRAASMAAACVPGSGAHANPGAWLGAVMGEAAIAGQDKLTLVLPPELSTLGCWIEQLVAESTGKEGRGIVPIEGENLADPAVYGNDRLFIAIGDDARLGTLEAAGHAVVRLPYQSGDLLALGAEFFRWEFATAVAGHILGVNPFDQPNVQEAKAATMQVLAGQEVDALTGPIESVLGSVRAGDYVAITAYVPRDEDAMTRFNAVRLRLRDRYRVATTVGFGPRFLHSTGQLHKGGPNSGVFLQVVQDDPADLPVPGEPFTFGRLKQAQALGDIASLRQHGRRVWRGTLTDLEDAVP